MSAQSSVQPSLTLKRRINAAPEKIYAAWTDPKKIVGWWGTRDAVTFHAEADLRVGGRFAIGFRTAEGVENNVSGLYREIVPNRKLVFTWAWRTTPERESLVTVSFKPDEGATILTLHHEQFFDETARANHERGWGQLFDALVYAEESEDASEIRTLLRRRSNALYNKDAEAVIELNADGGVAFELPPPLALSGPKSAAVAGIAGWFQTWRGPIDWRVSEPTIVANRDVAYAFGLSNMRGTKSDGENVDLWLRSTFCFRKFDGAWRIAHQHNSVPYYMDGSYRAAVDLRPDDSSPTRVR